jgi:type VI secretion system secreted protein VgrG
LEADGEIHIKAGTRIVLEAPDITLKGSGGYLRVDGGGVQGPDRHLVVGGGPAAAKGAHPELPEEPARADTERAPRRLPLIEFPAVPPRQFPGRGQPLNEHHIFLCNLICMCVDDRLPDRCVQEKLKAMDRASGGMSPYKPQVPYDMSKDPPEPIPSRNHPGPSTGRPGGSRVPDVVVVKDPTKMPTRDNIEEVVEIKNDDSLDDEQMRAYEKIAGEKPFRVLDPEECGCPKKKQAKEPARAPVEDAKEALLLTLAVMVLILNDAVPGGQLDDVLIGPALTRLGQLLPKLIKLLRPVPMLPVPVVP